MKLEGERAEMAIRLEKEKAELAHLEMRNKAAIAAQHEDSLLAAEKEKFEIFKVKLQLEADANKARLEQEAKLAIQVEQEKAKLNQENKEFEHELLTTKIPFDLAKT